MTIGIKHRGPDHGPDIISIGDTFFGAVRLSIVDVQYGHQPIKDNKTGNVVSLNGEIYNFKVLKKTLESFGDGFVTDCDTEVLLKGFTRFGRKFVEQLDGIFAISFYDKKADTLYLFRDYFGVKPLYYYTDNKSFYYASEIKSFFYLDKKFSMDEDYIIFNKIFNCSIPTQTLFKGIEAVEPSSWMKITAQRIYHGKYSPRVSIENVDSIDRAIELSRISLESAVSSQIPSEVDWGVLISGGVDSSILAWLCKKNSQDLLTFSICSSGVETDDLLNARQVAKELNTKHVEIRVHPSDIVSQYKDYVFAVEDINRRFVFYYFLSSELARYVKVALCGEGADELYGGYPVYRNIGAYFRQVEANYNQYKNRLSKRMQDTIHEKVTDLARGDFDSIYRFEIETQLPNFQLNPVDKCSMRFGVELRVPYLAFNHALQVMNYGENILKYGPIEKHVLRSAFSHTGLSTISRPKMFAGTRTLPEFYKGLAIWATEEKQVLEKKYPDLVGVLDDLDLLTLDLLVTQLDELKTKK